MNTLVEVILKKINFYGNRKKLQLLNYFKGESSKIYFLKEKFITKHKKDYKKLEKCILFGIVRVFTEHSKNTPLLRTRSFFNRVQETFASSSSKIFIFRVQVRQK